MDPPLVVSPRCPGGTYEHCWGVCGDTEMSVAVPGGGPHSVTREGRKQSLPCSAVCRMCVQSMCTSMARVCKRVVCAQHRIC